MKGLGVDAPRPFCYTLNMKAEMVKGQVGIRKILNDNERGWHYFYENDYIGWFDQTLDQVRFEHPTCKFEIVGNNIFSYKT